MERLWSDSNRDFANLFQLSIWDVFRWMHRTNGYDYYRVLPISFRNVVAARYFAYLAFTGIGF